MEGGDERGEGRMEEERAALRSSEISQVSRRQSCTSVTP